MPRVLLIMLCAMACGSCLAEPTDRPTIPSGVRYKFIDDKEDAVIRTSLAARFQQGEAAVAGIFLGPCTLAPGYWKIIADSDCVKQPIPSTFSVPNTTTGAVTKLKGAMAKAPEDLHRLARHFASDVGKTPVIRRLTADEISQVWAIFPFDLEEPLYVLENGSRHFLLILIKEPASAAYSALWVDVLKE